MGRHSASFIAYSILYYTEYSAPKVYQSKPYYQHNIIPILTALVVECFQLSMLVVECFQLSLLLVECFPMRYTLDGFLQSLF